MGAEFQHHASNLHIAYPFSDEVSDPVRTLFADAWVAHDEFPAGRRLRLDIFDPVSTPKLLKLVFENGDILVDWSTSNLPIDDVTYSTYVFGDYTVFQWSLISLLSDGFTPPETVARFTVLTSAIGDFTYPLLPTDAWLTPGVVQPRTDRVRRTAVKLPGVPCCIGGGFAEGAVAFEAGNNVRLSVKAPDRLLPGETAPVRRPTTVVIDAVPGAGTGRFPSCTNPDLVITSIKGVQPNVHGDWHLEGQDCLWWERPLTGSVLPPTRPHTDYAGTVLPHTMQLHADCVPCCDCSDFQAAYEAYTRLWNRALAVAARIEALRLRYNVLTADVLAAQDNDPVRLELTVTTRPDFHLAVGTIIANNSGQDLSNVSLTWNLAPIGFIFTEGSGILDTEFVRNAPASVLLFGNQVAMFIPLLRKGRQAGAGFEVRYPRGTTRLDVAGIVTLNALTALGTFTRIKAMIIKPPLEKT
jgi:hypothetical protein